MPRKVNVVLFSSGVSEKRGLIDLARNELQIRNCNCYSWRDLFAGSNDKNNIALLPMLIKKVPTFDFAILICEGHDKTTVFRDGESEELSTMRDNVLFEIGLCSATLGLERVILLTDETVRLPEDLIGLNGKLALKHISFSEKWDLSDKSKKITKEIFDDIFNYIQLNQKSFSPVVVGASASTASGYITNFIFRLIENLSEGFVDKETNEKIIPSKNKIKIEIYIPYEYDETVQKRAQKIKNELKRGFVTTARDRVVDFNYTVEDDTIVIKDYPTTLVTSYNTAKAILQLSADDVEDEMSEKRFIEKELDLFESSLYALINKQFFAENIRNFYSDMSEENQKRKIDELSDYIEQIIIIRGDY